jgi:hypothetical protein
MLAIKFRNRKKINVKKKIEIINSVFDIIAVSKRKKLYYSDYTFAEVEESTKIPLYDDLFKQNILDKLSNDHFITFTAEASFGSIRAEINPNKVRDSIFNCSHIDINTENEIFLYDILKEMNKIEPLINYLDSFKEIISEFYFFDLNTSPDSYSDVHNRVCSKHYDPIEYASLLLKNYKFDDRVDEKTTKAIACNFTSQIFQEKRQPFIQGIISENNLNLAAAAGSIFLQGEDMPTFMDRLLVNLDRYIKNIKEKDVYNIEFDRLYR